MSKLLCFVSGFFVSLALPFSLIGATEPARAEPMPAVDDPTVWTPPAELPHFSPVLNDGDLKNRCDAVRKVFLPAAANAPWCGESIREVEPDSQASRLGLHVGDTVLSIDGIELHGGEDFRLARNENADSQLARIWDISARVRRLVNFQPGKTGLKCSPFLRVDRMYLQSLPAGAVPDDDVLIACMTSASNTTDYDVIETLLPRIFARGKPPAVVYYLAANTAWARCRYDDSIAFCAAAEKALPPDQRWIIFWLKCMSAIGGFRLSVAADAEAQYKSLAIPESSPQYKAIETAIADFRKMPVQRMANPVEEFEKLASRDRLAELQIPQAHDAEVQLHKRRTYYTRSDGSDPNLSSQSRFTGPTGANVDFSATVTFKLVNEKPVKHEKCARFMIEQGENDAIFCLTLYPSGSGVVSGIDQLPQTRFLLPDIANGQKFKVRLTVVGNRMEAVVNQRRVYYGLARPPEDTRRLWLGIESNAVDEHISNFTWRTAEARKNAVPATAPK